MKETVSDQNTTEMQATVAVLEQLKKAMPEVWEKAQVVGQWVWVAFDARPLPKVRFKLKELGFHWSKRRRCWQHPCGSKSPNDPRESGKYEVAAAADMAMRERQ